MQLNQLQRFFSLWIVLLCSSTPQYLIRLDAAKATSATQWHRKFPNVSNISHIWVKEVNSRPLPQTTSALVEFPSQLSGNDTIVPVNSDLIRVPSAETTDEFSKLKLKSTLSLYDQTLLPTKSPIESSSTQQFPVLELADVRLPDLDLKNQSVKIVQSTTEQPQENINSQRTVEPPQVEALPNKPITPTPTQIEQRLEKPDDYKNRLERLLRLLEKTRQTASFGTDEIGTIIAKPVTESPQVEQPPLPTPQPVVKKPPVSKPIGYLLGRVSYFQTNNLFSSKIDPIEDGLIYSGVTLASERLQLGQKTFLNSSLDANIIRYINQSEFNYNQLRLNIDLYQQFSPQMYGEIGWSNQQLFYARNSRRFGFASGDRFLNENSFHLSLGRRDPITPKLMFDSYYELRWSLAEIPQRRDRISNSLWVSLSYYLQQSLNVGLDYQLTLSNFTQRDREDLYHRIFTHLNYKATDISNINFQGGVSIGNSTEPNINFDGWFLSINYSWELGRF